MKINSKIKDFLLPASAFGLLLFVWHFITRLAEIPSYILPGPLEIIKEFNGQLPDIWRNYTVTLLESFIGMLLGSALGFIFGCFIAEYKTFRKISLPFLIGSNAIPIVAIAPIILIWFGSGLASKVAVTAFISFFPLAMNTYRGLSEYQQLYSELFLVYGASKREFLFKYKIGNAAPYIFTGLKLNATLSVIGSIVAEFVSADRGIGFAILQASYSFNSSKLWGYILLACSIGVTFYLIIYIIEVTFFKKYKTN